MDRSAAGRPSEGRRRAATPLVIFGWTTTWEDLLAGVMRYMVLPFVQGVMLGLGHYGTRYALARLLPPIRPAARAAVKAAADAEPAAATAAAPTAAAATTAASAETLG